MNPDSARRATFPSYSPPTPMRVGPSPSNMSLSLATADLRASLLRELRRLDASPHAGGPSVAIRGGALLACVPHGRVVVVDADLLAVLRRLSDGAGADAVAGVLAP